MRAHTDEAIGRSPLYQMPDVYASRGNEDPDLR
jgi:hypothetical protein